jgi:CO/xanthine dehydrogenase FAD-binding subunit
VTTAFRSVRSLDEALGVLEELGDRATVLAGGTDVMVQYQRGELDPGCLVHIERVPGLDELASVDGRLALGALVTHHRIATDRGLRERLPALAESCATVGGWQTQAVGTVVGNVCNASPAADTLPPLLVADAAVRLASTSGRRTVPIEEFVVGRRRIAARPGELVSRIDVEPCGEAEGEVYLKVAPRTAMEVAVVGLAVRIALDGDAVADARIAVCAAGPVPFRARAAEEALAGCSLEPATIRAAGDALAEAAQPIDDGRAAASYRRAVLGPLLGRAVEIASRRAKGA